MPPPTENSTTHYAIEISNNSYCVVEHVGKYDAEGITSELREYITTRIS